MLKEYRTLLPYVGRYARAYLLGILFLFVTNFGLIYIPQILRSIIDIIAGGGFTLNSLIPEILLMVGIAFAVAAGRFGWRFFILGSSRKVEKELRSDLFSHLLTLGSGFYGRMKTGDIMARATNDMRAVRMAAGMGLVAFFDGSIMLIAIIIIMLSQFPSVAIYTIIPLPIITAVVLGLGPLLGVRFRRVQEGFSSLSEQVQENLAGVRVIKSYVREDHYAETFEQKNIEYRKRNMKLVRIWGFFFPMTQFLSGVTILILLIIGGTSVIEGRLSPGSFVAMMSYLTMLIWPMMGAGWVVNIIQRGAASLGRINSILREEPDIISPPGAVKEIKDISIRIQNLTYQFDDAEEPVLHDINLEIDAGTTLGVLGRTGAGKTTLIRMLPRILDPPPNTVFVGGIDVREYDLKALRRVLGIVPQDSFLFSATIRENIAFGNPDLPDEAIKKYAKMSTIDRDINQFPRGYETEVGERGITLSGGQKQRIAISRAMAIESKLLIFDDALSSVDTETEEKILKAYLSLRSGKTNILISHRVSTLERADKIIVLDKGRVIQEGTPLELQQKEGLYREIYLLQQLERKGEDI